jgi:hypothetical protein
MIVFVGCTRASCFVARRLIPLIHPSSYIAMVCYLIRRHSVRIRSTPPLRVMHSISVRHSVRSSRARVRPASSARWMNCGCIIVRSHRRRYATVHSGISGPPPICDISSPSVRKGSSYKIKVDYSMTCTFRPRHIMRSGTVVTPPVVDRSVSHRPRCKCCRCDRRRPLPLPC